MPRKAKPIIKEPVTVVETEDKGDGDGESGLSAKDLKLPETTVIKMMKEVLPKNAIVSQEAKDCMRRMPTIFALYITDLALRYARECKRRTILPEDIVDALEEADFPTFAEKIMPLVERRKANYRSRKSRTEDVRPGNMVNGELTDPKLESTNEPPLEPENAASSTASVPYPFGTEAFSSNSPLPNDEAASSSSESSSSSDEEEEPRLTMDVPDAEMVQLPVSRDA